MFYAKDVFERTNGAFNGCTSGIQLSPIWRTAQDARIEAQIGVRVDVNTAPVFGSGTRILASTAQRAALDRGGNVSSLWTDKFQPFGSVLPAANTMEFQLSSIVRAKRDTELVQKRLVSVCGIAAIYGNNGSCKPKLSQQGAVSVIAVKSRVAQEGLIAQIWMFFVEIPQDWEQRP